jgi:hypothetical protein
MAKITYQHVTNVIDKESGEVLSEESSTTTVLPKEPEFIKLYLSDLAKLNDLPQWVTGILHELLKHMDYDNRIILSAGVKREIASSRNTSVQVVSNTLGKFVDKGILFRKDTGIYIVNPYLFGKGSWPNIQKIRLTVTYGADKGREMKAEVVYEEQD